MRLSSLEMWPDAPCLDNVYEPWSGVPLVNAIERLVFGLSHDDSHLGQISPRSCIRLRQHIRNREGGYK